MAIAEKTGGVEDYIILAPDPRLRQYWPDADDETTEETAKEIARLSLLGAKDGRSLAGLSSVQVELPGRVVTARDFRVGGFLRFIRPIVIERSWETRVGREGCFSLEKNKYYSVRRPEKITIQHGLHGEIKTTLSGDTARFALHEVDHINGILISDYQGA